MAKRKVKHLCDGCEKDSEELWTYKGYAEYGAVDWYCLKCFKIFLKEKGEVWSGEEV